MTENMQELNFIFTENDFYPDGRGFQDCEDRRYRAFEVDRYSTLYHMGFKEKMKNMSAAGEYLYLLSTTFFDCLTRLSELELARDAVKPKPSDEQLEKLLSSIPFAVGAEYIDEDWILHIFERLTEVFAD